MTDRIRNFLESRREDGPRLVLDLDVVRDNYNAFAKALPDSRVFYAVKANPDPAVLKLIKMSIDTADAHGRPISMCGQMSGNPLYTMLLLGLGLRSLSATPAAAPEVKRVCRSVSIAECQAVAERALEMESARDVKALLREEMLKRMPDHLE